MIPVTWYLIPDICYLVPNIFYLLHANWNPIANTWYLIPRTWYLIFDIWYLILTLLTSLNLVLVTSSGSQQQLSSWQWLHSTRQGWYYFHYSCWEIPIVMSIEPYSIWAAGGSNLKYGPGYRSSQFLDNFYKNLEPRSLQRIELHNHIFTKACTL